MSSSDRITRAINQSDHPELLHLIDELDDSSDYEQLVLLGQQCHRAIERGHQLGAITAHAAYRLALQAPLSFFVELMFIADDRFTPGPFPEVLAAMHNIDALAQELPLGALRSNALAEAVVRGDIGDREASEMFDTPPVLAAWEPSYALAEYRTTTADFPEYELSPPQASQRRKSDPRAEPSGTHAPASSHTTEALREAVSHWAAQSTGRVECHGVTGPVEHALQSLGIPGDAISSVTPKDGLGRLAWAAASGAAHGRRRGAASGRFAAWWAAAALSGCEWPCVESDLGAAVDQLEWFTFLPHLPTLGWELRLAIHSPAQHCSWALSATDMA